MVFIPRWSLYTGDLYSRFDSIPYLPIWPAQYCRTFRPGAPFQQIFEVVVGRGFVDLSIIARGPYSDCAAGRESYTGSESINSYGVTADILLQEEISELCILLGENKKKIVL